MRVKTLVFYKGFEPWSPKPLNFTGFLDHGVENPCNLQGFGPIYFQGDLLPGDLLSGRDVYCHTC